MAIMNLKDYEKKVLGCWMGKNIGGTLGAPFEWHRQINNVSFYTQDLDGNPLPNDDLDIQLIWLIAMEEMGINVDAKILADYWQIYVTPHWAEYGNAKTNLKSGLMPPLSGTYNNFFKDSCGAFIRSEIWACIAPGCPQLAVQYAFEDAIIDHGNGEGTYGEIFCAALESAAFVESDINRLINIGLSYIPQECAVAQAVRAVIKAYESGNTWLESRDMVLDKFRGKCIYGLTERVSGDDLKKGFADGNLGWDVPSNIGILIIGLLYGGGDFGETLCITVNCGEDTDCTGATVGSIFGIINGIDAIPEKWTKPIGKGIKTMCLNLGELQNQLPETIDDLTERTKKIAQQVSLRNRTGAYNVLELSETDSTDIGPIDYNQLMAGTIKGNLCEKMDSVVYSFPFFNIHVNYPDGLSISTNRSIRIKVKIIGKYKIPENLNYKWYTPDDWIIDSAEEGSVYISTGGKLLPGMNEQEMEFTIIPGFSVKNTSRCVLEFTVEGKSTVMLVPVIFKLNADQLV